MVHTFLKKNLNNYKISIFNMTSIICPLLLNKTLRQLYILMRMSKVSQN